MSGADRLADLARPFHETHALGDWHAWAHAAAREGDRPHPATFPPDLAAYLYRLHGTHRIRTTLDPFSGLASSAVAAAQLGLPIHHAVEIAETTHVEAVRRFRAQFEYGPESDLPDFGEA